VELDVLVVEDDANDAELAEASVRRTSTPIGVHHARTLAEATDQVRGEFFDVVVLDLGLPDSDGTASVEVLRAAGADSAIVVLSNTTDENTVLACLAAGAEDFVPKPSVRGASLAGAVIRGAARHEARRRRISAQLDEITDLGRIGQWWRGPDAARRDATLADAAGTVRTMLDRLGRRTHVGDDADLARSLAELVSRLGEAGMGLDEVMAIHALAVQEERAEVGDMAAYTCLAGSRTLLLRLLAGLLEYYRRAADESAGPSRDG
jgi:CheY-like chemotaxis protein